MLIPLVCLGKNTCDLEWMYPSLCFACIHVLFADCNMRYSMFFWQSKVYDPRLYDLWLMTHAFPLCSYLAALGSAEFQLALM